MCMSSEKLTVYLLRKMVMNIELAQNIHPISAMGLIITENGKWKISICRREINLYLKLTHYF